MIFNRSLTLSERVSIERDLASRWGIMDHGSHCQTGFNCTEFGPKAPSAQLVTRLRSFVTDTATAPLNETLAHTMASVALSYLAAAKTRCAGLANGSIPVLRSKRASDASLLQLVTTAA